MAGFNANNQTGGGGGDYTPQEALEAGTYPGRLVQIATLGLQNQRPFKGKEKPPQEMMYTSYELSHEFMKDDDGNDDVAKPRWCGEDFPFYSLEADRATSTKRYTAIDPTGQCGGDWEKALSFPCQITLSKEPRKGKEGQFVNYITHVSGAMTVPGYDQPVLVNAPRIFDIETPDMEIFKVLPEWVRKKASSNLNYQGSALQAALGETAAQPAPTPQAAPAAAPPQPAAPVPPPAPSAPAVPTPPPVPTPDAS